MVPGVKFITVTSTVFVYSIHDGFTTEVTSLLKYLSAASAGDV